MTTSNTLFARTAVVALFCAAAFAVQAEDTMSKDMDMNMDMSNMSHSTDTMNSKQMTHEQMTVKTYPLHGKIEQIDTNNLTITLAHNAVTELAWPAMTMTFPVAKVQLLNGLSVGQTIDARITANENEPPMIQAIKLAK